MATLTRERFSSSSTGASVPFETNVDLKLENGGSVYKSADTDAVGFASFDLQSGATLLPGNHYLEATVGGATRKVYSNVFGVQGRELIGAGLTAQLFSSGVLDNVLNEMIVTAPGSAMTTRVGTGAINLVGTIAPCNTLVTLTHDAAHGSLARIDRIVARLTLTTTDFGMVELDVLTGTPHASPTPPALTQDDEIHEEMLADVSITAALGTITSGNLNDRRTFSGPAVIGSVLQAALDGKQPLNPELTAVAGLGTFGLATRTADDTWAVRAIVAGTGIAVTNSNGAAGNPTIAVNAIPQSSVTNLTTDLAGKAASSHTHAQSDITGLVAALAAKAPAANPTFSGVATMGTNGHLVFPDGRIQYDHPTGDTVVDGPAAGSTGAVGSLNSGGDWARFILTPGGTGIAAGEIVQVTFANARADANFTVAITPGDSDAATAVANLGIYADAASFTATGFSIFTNAALTSGTTYRLGYFVIGR